MNILPDLSTWPLRKKLVSIIILSSMLCLLVSLSVLVGSSIFDRYKDSLLQLSGLANVLAENGQAALMFSDRAEAQRLLESLSSHNEIAAAWLVQEDETVLASWSRDGVVQAAPSDYKSGGKQIHSEFWSRRADFYLPVTRGAEHIGYVLLKADFTERLNSQIRDLGKGLGGAALAMIVVLLLAPRLQRIISSPLAELADAAATISRDKTYGLRVPQRTDDEIGDLVAAFNKMLGEIQERDENLMFHRDCLEDEVNRRAKELRSIIENTPDTIARYDKYCRRIYVNPAFDVLAIGGAAALLGKTPSESPGGPNSQTYEEKVEEVFATGKNTQFELRWPGKEGREVCSHIRLTAELDSSGNVISVLGVGRDISELNEFQAELQRKELAKTRFLAAAGHDMRQPLAAANLFIDALKQTDPTPDQNKIISRLELAMSNFDTLLDTLLNVSKLDAGMIKPEYTSINVIELFNWIEQNLEPLASDKKLRFKFYFAMNETLVIRSDIALIQSILMNLVSNAIKFTTTGGILVSARRRGGNVLFQVWDTGLGIKDEHLEKVFDEFYQINNPQRDRARGLGLGLSIVKRALLLLGQEISYRSQVGHGSVFGFRLPLEDESNETSQQEAATVPHENINQGATQGKRFVVVEDDALVAEALSQALEGIGGEVKIFHEPEVALNHFDLDDADYCIVDFMLGGTLNGIQFLNLLTQKLGRPVKAIIMTGDTSPDFVREAANCIWPVLHKPVSIAKIIACLNMHDQ